MIRFRSPVTVPLHPPRGDAPRQGDHFYVTQRFADLDAYWSNVPNPPNPLPAHRATDIGNGRCGYPIVAMAAGRARRVKDNASGLGAPNDALGIVIDHGQGVTTAYWHLASWSVPDGARVAAGQEIGKLGNTGLGQVCHCHIEATLNGERIDPEPLMFGGRLILEEEPVLNDKTVYLAEPFRARIRSGVAVRTDPRISDETLALITNADVEVTVIGRAFGAEFGGSRNWHVFGADKQGLRCVHSVLTERLGPPGGQPAPDCSPLENRIAGGLTAAKGARQAINAVVTALEG